MVGRETKKCKFFKLMLQKLLIKTIRGMELILCIHDIDISLYINCMYFCNSGCYGSVKFQLTYNIMGKLELPFISLLLQIFLKRFTEMFLE